MESYRSICDLVSVFDKHQIAYVIGGSVCSSFHGIYRSTNDVDVLVAGQRIVETDVLQELSKSFLVDEVTLNDEFSRGRAFNIFHEETAIKIDLFPAKTTFHRSELSRAITVQPPSAPCLFKVATAEDIILAKLLWLERTQSERQRSDIKAVLNVSVYSLDWNYLENWSRELGVINELRRIKAE